MERVCHEPADYGSFAGTSKRGFTDDSDAVNIAASIGPPPPAAICPENRLKAQKGK